MSDPPDTEEMAEDASVQPRVCDVEERSQRTGQLDVRPEMAIPISSGWVGPDPFTTGRTVEESGAALVGVCRQSSGVGGSPRATWPMYS